MIQKITDISEQELYEFLSYCMCPIHDRIVLECNKYRRQKNREIYGIYVEKRLAGIAGLQHEEYSTELKHIAILPIHRKIGLGSNLINAIIGLETIDKLFAETDKDAVDFYKKNGFEIISLGEKYPGVERFNCVYNCKNK